MVGCMMTTMIVNGDGDIIKYIYNIFMIILVMVLTINISEEKFIEMFTNIMYIISIFAVILFLIGFFLNPAYKMMPYISNENYLRYYFFGLGFLEDLPVGSIPRIYGIFREPGVFACYLTLALLLELLSKKETDIKKALFYLLAAYTTFSTAAFTLCIVCLSVYFLRMLFQGNSEQRRKMFKIVIITVFIITGCVMFMGSERVYELVFNKLHVENSSRDSRFGSIAANLSMFYTNPIVGRGWNFVEDNFIYFASTGVYAGTHNTNTLLKLLALYGLFPFTILVMFLVKFFKKRTRSIFYGLVLTAIWVIALSNEDLSVNVILYILPFYGIYTLTNRN